MVQTERNGQRLENAALDPLLAEVTQVTKAQQLEDQSLVEELLRDGRILVAAKGVQGGALEREVVYTFTIFPIRVSQEVSLYYPNLDTFILEAKVNGKTYRSQIFNVDEDTGRWIDNKLKNARLKSQLHSFLKGVRDGFRSAVRRG